MFTFSIGMPEFGFQNTRTGAIKDFKNQCELMNKTVNMYSHMCFHDQSIL